MAPVKLNIRICGARYCDLGSIQELGKRLYLFIERPVSNQTRNRRPIQT